MQTTPHVWQLIQRWMDGQVIRVNQSQLADAIGVSRQTVSQWKSGEVRPSPRTVQQLANVTRIPYADLTAALLLDMGYIETEQKAGEGHVPASNSTVNPARVNRDLATADSTDDPGLPGDLALAADATDDRSKPFDYQGEHLDDTDEDEGGNGS